MNFIIEEWATEHPRWQELVQIITAENQADGVFTEFLARFPQYFLVAMHENKILGFLMFFVWEIGPHDRNHPPLQLNGVTLTEAKIIAFGVQEAYRRQGIGRALQEHALKRAREMGCHQVRSVSGSGHPENLHLKLSMGFAVEPMEREEPSLSFIMPLQTTRY